MRIAKQVKVFVVSALLPIVGVCGYSLVASRKDMLVLHGRMQSAKVKQAMSALGIPKYWQEWHLKTYYKFILEKDGAKWSTPKYACVRLTNEGGTGAVDDELSVSLAGCKSTSNIKE